MARELVTKSGRFYCISLEPDICKTPMGPSTHAVPYTIKGEFAEATGISPNIRSGGAQVVIHASTVIPSVTGDEAGTAKGVKSNTVSKRVQHDERSATVSLNGERAIREGDRVFMNDRNTTGKIYERRGASASASPSGPGERAVAQSVATDSASDPLLNLLMAVWNPTGTVPSVAGSMLQLRDAVTNAAASEFGLPDLQKLSAVIAPALLNKLPGAAAATTLSQNAARGVRSVDNGDTPSRTRVDALKEFPEFPGWAARILTDNHVTVYLVRDNVVEAFPWLRGRHPTGHPLDVTYDQIAGIYLDEVTSVAIAPESKRPSGSFDTPFHELAHAVNRFGKFSDSEDFRQAWGKDYDALVSDYYRQAKSGHGEAFAEGFARYYRGQKSMPVTWPNIHTYFRTLDSCMTSGKGAC
jgi:hypothetical protein